MYALNIEIFKEKRQAAVMAEWLRRWTWNPMGSSRAGSNPARSESFFLFFDLFKTIFSY